MIDRKIFRDVFAQATPQQQYLVDSPYSGEHLFGLSQKYNFDKEKDILLCRTVSEIILGFYKIEDTVPLLQQELSIDPKTAALLGADVLEFLAPLSDPNWQPPVEEDVDEDTPENMPVIPTAPFVTEQIPEPVNRIPLKSPALYDTPATQVPVTPEVFIPPAAMPVMAQPTPVTTPVFEPAPVGYGVPTTPAPTPTYSSTQPAMSAPTLSPIPSYTPTLTPPVAPPPAPAPDRPRWSTEI